MNARIRRIEMGRTSNDDIVVRGCLLHAKSYDDGIYGGIRTVTVGAVLVLVLVAVVVVVVGGVPGFPCR